MQVEIWSDVVCPWCYLGKRHFERALEQFPHRGEVEVTYRSFELDPSAPPGANTATVELLASKYGMTLEQAREAHRLLHLAKAQGKQAEMAERLHRAYFTDQVSIFDHSSLADLAASVGLDHDKALGVLASDDYGQAVDDDEKTARSFGVNGVPFFVIDRRYGVSGAQPPEIMTQVLDRAWAETEETSEGG